MRYLPIIISILLVSSMVYGQNSPKNSPKARKVYSVSTGYTDNNGKKVYDLNGKATTKEVYEFYSKSFGRACRCHGCHLQWFDENENLLSEGIYDTDCPVGWNKRYYPNGNLKEITNWKRIKGKDRCSVPHGEWVYFNENGDTLYSEFWEKGAFIKQVPEQDSCGIWDFDVMLDGIDVNNVVIPINRIRGLELKPKFKNSNTNANVIVKASFYPAIGFGEQTIALDDFKLIKIPDNSDKTKEEVPYELTLRLFQNGKFIEYIKLKLGG